MSKVSAEWDAMCSVLVIDREKFQLNLNPAAGEFDNIKIVLENGYVRTLLSEWLKNLPVTTIKSLADNEPAIEFNPKEAGDLESLAKEEPQDYYDVTKEQKSDTKGRFVVSTKDLQSGDPIVREKAFVLVPVYTEDYVPGRSQPLCSNCASSVTQSKYVCRNCHRISYCSQQCLLKDESRHIHRYECKGHLMGLFHDLGVSHLAVHALLAGIAERPNENPLSFLEPVDRDPSELEAFGYSRVLRLSTNFAHMSADDYLRFALTAVMFTFYLRNHTDFSRQDFSEEAIGSLLLRHMGQIINNAHTMYALSFRDSNEIPLGHMHDHAKVVVNATALFPRIAILNHSCDPNIRNRFDGNVLTIKATRTIHSHEEIFNGYCPSYKLLETAKRRQLLKEQYSFDCDCSWCEQQSESVVLKQYQTYICQTANCNTHIVPDASQSKWWLAGDAPASPLVCSECRKPLDLGWSDNFMMLFERDVASVQQLKYLTEDACAAYAEACKRMFGAYHVQKCELASMVLKLMPLAQLEFTRKDVVLVDALIAIASDYAACVGEQFGEHSLERIEASGHWMDLVARRKAVTTESKYTDDIQNLLAIITLAVPKETSLVYEKYFADYLF